MPGAGPLPLYVANSIEELAHLADLPKDFTTKPARMLCKTAETVILAAKDSECKGDEERAYVLFVKFTNIYLAVKKMKDYKADPKYYDNILRGHGNVMEVMDKLEEMKTKLKERYTVREAAALAARLAEQAASTNNSKGSPGDIFNLPEVPQDELDDLFNSDDDDTIISNGHKAESPIPFADEDPEQPRTIVTPEELYDMLNHADVTQRPLVIDVRELYEFEDSRIKMENISCVNIDPVAHIDGSSPTMRSIITRVTDTDAASLLAKRGDFPMIILVDKSSSIEVGISETLPIFKLHRILTDFETQVILKHPPVILEGGYDSWLRFYPQFSTNPLKKNMQSEPKKQLDVNLIDYDMDFFEPLKPEPAVSPITSEDFSPQPITGQDPLKPHPLDNSRPPTTQQPLHPQTSRSMPTVDRNMKPPNLINKPPVNTLSSTDSFSKSEPFNVPAANRNVPTTTNDIVNNNPTAKSLNTNMTAKPSAPSVNRGLKPIPTSRPNVQAGPTAVQPPEHSSPSTPVSNGTLDQLTVNANLHLDGIRKETEKAVAEKRARTALVDKEQAELTRIEGMKAKELKEVSQLMRMRRELEQGNNELRNKTVVKSSAETDNTGSKGATTSGNSNTKPIPEDNLQSPDPVAKVSNEPSSQNGTTQSVAKSKNKDNDTLPVASPRKPDVIPDEKRAATPDSTPQPAERPSKPGVTASSVAPPTPKGRSQPVTAKPSVQPPAQTPAQQPQPTVQPVAPPTIPPLVAPVATPRSQPNLPLSRQPILQKPTTQQTVTDTGVMPPDQSNQTIFANKNSNAVITPGPNVNQTSSTPDPQSAPVRHTALPPGWQRVLNDRGEHVDINHGTGEKSSQPPQIKTVIPESRPVVNGPSHTQAPGPAQRPSAPKPGTLQPPKPTPVPVAKPATPRQVPSVASGSQPLGRQSTSRLNDGATHDLDSGIRYNRSQSTTGSNLKRFKSQPDLKNLADEEPIQRPVFQAKPATPQVDRQAKPTPVMERQVRRPKIEELSSQRISHLSPAYGKVKPGLTGLYNLGNQCYMNAALQCLSNTPILLQYIVEGHYEDDINSRNREGSRGLIANEFSFLLRRLWEGRYHYVYPRDFKTYFGRVHDKFSHYKQMDSQEFLMHLLDTLHEDLNSNGNGMIKNTDTEKMDQHMAAEIAAKEYKMKNNSIFVNLFNGQHRSSVVCLVCRNRSPKFDMFRELALELPAHGGRCTLQDCLGLYLEGEKMDDYKCEKCKSSGKAVKKLDFWSLPHTLVICLKRFIQNYTQDTFSKKNNNVIYSETLRLNVCPESRSKASEYTLYGVVNHTGTLNSGHYTAYCKNGGRWYLYNDETVREVSSSSVISPAAYVLFYTKRV